MARIHSHKRGKSHSMRPTSRRAPAWSTYSPDEVTNYIVKMAKDGLTPSEIGVKLRDEYNVPLAKSVLGRPVLEVLKEHHLEKDLPEDLDRLIKRAKKLQEHLKAHRNDSKNVRSLELIEAKIHRLSKYYKAKGVLPQSWRYSTVIAQLM
ncbi:MAG: 30S ribosomal protein S15 [Nitrososphaerales archaeon]|nr:30S ribosomal protein S15 [Nitrososphaerales archaeon]